jgi:hypothetical protein
LRREKGAAKAAGRSERAAKEVKSMVVELLWVKWEM